MEQYRVFINDVGPNCFSGLYDLRAASVEQAKQAARKKLPRSVGQIKVLVIPHRQKNYWPNGQTGAVPLNAMRRFGMTCET